MKLNEELKFDGKNIQTSTNSNRLISKRSRHLKNKTTHGFTWNVLMAAPVHNSMRKNLEASFIALGRPSMNEQINSKKLLLFRNGVT